MTQTEASHIPTLSNDQVNQNPGSKGCGLTTPQILAITVPLALLGLFCALFFPIYFTQKKTKTKTKLIFLNPNETQDNSSDINIDEETDLVTNIEDIVGNTTEFDEFE